MEIVLIKIIIRLFLDQFSKLRLILPQQLLSSSDNIPLFCKIFINNNWYRKQVADDIFGSDGLFLLLLFVVLLGGRLRSVQLHRPASGRNHIAIILHSFAPVIHQAVIDIISIDKRLINPENLQQRVTQLLDEFLGSKSGYEGVKLFAMTITPLRKTILKSIALLTEINILVNDITYSIQFTLQRIVTFARRMVAKEIITKRRAHFPIGVKLIYIMFGQATMKVGIDILQNLRIGSKYIARNIEIVIVTLNLLHRHKARIMRYIALCLPHIDNAANILFPQTVLCTIFDIPALGIDHKHPFTPYCFRLLNDDDTSRNTRTIKEVCW